MSFVLRQTTQLELSQEDEAASGGLGIASALTANRNGSYQSTTSPSIVRSLSTSPDELLDSPPPPPPLSDHRRSSISGTTKQQQHFICSSTTNRGTAPAANNSTTRSIIRIQVWLSWVDFCFVCYVIKKKDTHAHTKKKWHVGCHFAGRGREGWLWARIDGRRVEREAGSLLFCRAYFLPLYWCCPALHVTNSLLGHRQDTCMSTHERSRQMTWENQTF